MDETKDVAVVEDTEYLPSSQTTPIQSDFVSMIERLAANPEVDVSKIEQIMNLQERVLDRDAAKAFNADMVACQGAIKVVRENKKNAQTRSTYADLTAILKSIKPVYTSHGFALSFYEGTTDKENHVRVMVDIMHTEGHSKTRFKDFTIDNVGIKGSVNKTNIHGNQSAFMYGRRVLTCMIFNVPTGENDDDGNAAGGTMYINDDQQSKITDMLIAIYGDDHSPFLEYIGVSSVDQIPANQYDEHSNGLKSILAKRGKK